ncbi:MAG TPA: tRNA (guanosine(37)-N1)-methyltransferase TrmD [Terracidiphilus sp.]|jgi:tRNA (guanine37-N1)-methyltransferase|nr:tRNA (guanosine(37)-N1)-methyltransferase TrmD [Terracidiphilus sp.]
MRFEIITIFPEFFSGFFEHGVVRRALKEGLVSVGVRDLREFTHDRHRTVDDRPFGGGEGMVLKPEPLAEALESLGIQPKAEREASFPTLAPEKTHKDGAPNSEAEDAAQAGMQVILLSAQGRRFTQAVARELTRWERVILLCGRYEGVDERINSLYCDMELSIGDYVLSGGELAAAVVMDAVTRLVPGVLGNEASTEFESFGITDSAISTDETGIPRSQHGSGGLLDYPHFTRPAEFKGLATPQVLLNGDHQQIRRWRREQQLRKTLANRPDLLEEAELSDEDRRMLVDLGWRPGGWQPGRQQP